MGRMNLADARTRKSTVDREKLDATTDEDIRRHQAEDGFADVEPPAVVREVRSPREIRVGLGMTQREIAAALHIPLGTWRNWEQGRVSLDPAARSLLEIVSQQPAIALEALQSRPPTADEASNFARFMQTRNTALEKRLAPANAFADICALTTFSGLNAGQVSETSLYPEATPNAWSYLVSQLRIAVASQGAATVPVGEEADATGKPATRTKRKPTTHG